MANTVANLATRSLKKGRVVGTGQPVDSEDQADVESVIPRVFADLSGRNVYSVADNDDIDDAAFEWLADIVWATVAPGYPNAVPPNPVDRVITENMLRRLTAASPTYETHRMEYF